jgi:predicted transcriptional regulator
MARHRQRVDIVASVLEATVSGAKRTKIMRFANLSHRLLVKYLEETVTIGFVRCDNDFYEATERGRVFLEKYRGFVNKYARLDKQIETRDTDLQALERMCSSNSA